VRWLAALIVLAEGGLTHAAERVSPITPEPTNEWRPGKVVWADLVTSDLLRATDFYRQVFGWAIRLSDDGSFAEATYRGRPIASFARYGHEAPEGEAQWLISISVPDVGAAAAAVRRNGGEVLEGPDNLRNRGRYVVATDSRGALLMFLRASGGDPGDDTPAANEWLWAELWTDDPTDASAFYETVVGYRTVEAREKDGGELLVMGRDGVARATVVRLPWPEVKPNWLIYLLVDDLEATLELVRRNGGEVLVHPSAAGDGNVAIVADPTGGAFALQQREVRR
jgi:predicted enzyme related to lactoylglutathione lyase